MPHSGFIESSLLTEEALGKFQCIFSFNFQNLRTGELAFRILQVQKLSSVTFS